MYQVSQRFCEMWESILESLQFDSFSRSLAQLHHKHMVVTLCNYV